MYLVNSSKYEKLKRRSVLIMANISDTTCKRLNDTGWGFSFPLINTTYCNDACPNKEYLIVDKIESSYIFIRIFIIL